MHHSLRLIEFAHELARTRLPPALAAQAKRCLLDNLGCGLFGASRPWSQIMLAEVKSDRSTGPCTVFGCEHGMAATAAALVNGCAIHGFELDDLIASALIHPGTVIIPAVLAAGEAAGSSGSQTLAAIVAGYEATARISLALGVEPSQRGFHKTSVVGPVAAAIAAGAAMELTVTQLQNAVGLACSMASGIKAFAAGAGGGMVKRMHAGRAAEAGVRAAQLARRGFTGPASALDGQLGLLEAFSGSAARPERLAEGLGSRWYIDDVWIKVYPMCGWIQGVAQLLVDLRGPDALALDKLERISVGTSAFAVKHNGNRAPTDEMEAQYSIPYCAALALQGDPGDPNGFALSAIGDPARQRLAERVEIRTDSECDAVYPNRFGSRIELELTSGERRQAFTLDPHGTPAHPLTDSEVAQKFRRLSRLSPCPVDAAAIERCVHELDAMPNLQEITRSLRPDPSLWSA